MVRSSLCFVLCVLSFALSTMPAAAATKVFLLAGQSNMVGAGVSAELVGPLAKYTVAQPKVKFWSGAQWLSSPVNSTTFGPEVSFGHEMQAAFPDDDIYLVKWAQGSTSLYEDWKPDVGWCYKTFKTTALAAIKNLNDANLAPTVAGMLWMQGERDAVYYDTYYATEGTSYQANLTNFITTMRTDFSTPDMPFVLGRIIQSYGTPENNTLVRTAQVTVSTPAFHTAWVDTDDLELSLTNPGHYGTQGQIDLGTLFADKLTPAPEPSTLILTGMGLLCLAYRWRRRRRGTSNVAI